MKTLCATATVIAILATSGLAQQAGQSKLAVIAASITKPSPLVADTATFDFGEVRQGTMVKHTFQVRNTTSNEIRVANIRTSCGCTTTHPLQDAFAPGEAQALEVSFFTGGKLGPQRRLVEVVSSTDAKPLVLTLTGTVLSPTLPLSTDN